MRWLVGWNSWLIDEYHLRFLRLGGGVVGSGGAVSSCLLTALLVGGSMLSAETAKVSWRTNEYGIHCFKHKQIVVYDTSTTNKNKNRNKNKNSKKNTTEGMGQTCINRSNRSSGSIWSLAVLILESNPSFSILYTAETRQKRSRFPYLWASTHSPSVLQISPPNSRTRTEDNWSSGKDSIQFE